MSDLNGGRVRPFPRRSMNQGFPDRAARRLPARAEVFGAPPELRRLLARLTLLVSGLGFLPPRVVGAAFAGAPPRASISSTASAKVSCAGSRSFGTDALTSPCLTYGP